MVVAPTSAVAGSGGNTLTFTYTADPAGMTNGEVDLTVPTSWTTPSTTNGGAGCTTSSTGTVSISTPGGNAGVITVTGVTLAGSGTMIIMYGATSGACSSSTGVSAPTATGSYTFAAAEEDSGGPPQPLATSPAVTVGPAGLNSFVVTATGGGAIGTQTAGQSFDVMLTAQDQYGNTKIDFDGTVVVSSNKTCSAGCGTSAAFSSGVLAAHALTLTQAGSGATVTVTRSSGTESGTSNLFTVFPGSADHLTLAGSVANLAAGSSRTLTAEIDDAFGNRVDSTASVTFAQTAGTGTVSGLGSVSASGGVASREVTGIKAGTVTIQASSSGIAAATITFTVVPGAADHLTLAGSTADLAAESSRTLTAEIDDAFGNTIDSTDSVTFAQTAGTGTVSGLGSVSASGGVATKQVTGVQAGTITIQASSSGIAAATISFQVIPGAADHLMLTGSTANLAAGSTRTLTAEIEDAFGNTVDSTASVTFAKTGGNGALLGLGSSSASGGIASRQVTGDKWGAVTIRASSGGVTSASITFRVVPGAAKGLVFTMSTGKLKLGNSALLAVEIQDAHGNRVPSPARGVTFAQAAGAGRVAGLGKVRSEAGVAWALIDALKKGSIQLKATVPGLTAATVKFKIVK